MEMKELLVEGKSKQIFQSGEPDKIIVHYKDTATAYNEIKIANIANKGIINNQISAIIYEQLEAAGIRTHFIRTLGKRDQLCRKVEIIPVEVIVRNIIAGSMCKRLGIPEGTKPLNTIYDLCYKNKNLGDPLINDHQAVALGLVTYDELEYIYGQTRRIDEVLSGLFAKIRITLVDFKIEFGRTPEGGIILADEISPDSCRLWDMDTGKKLDKDRFRRDMGKVIEGYNEILSRLKAEYAPDDCEIHEECGVFGIYNVKDAAQFVYYGLHSLQHRGQEACGIVTVDGEGRMMCKKDEGLVVEVFNQDNLSRLEGDKAIGHVRYSTAGGGGYDNVQPFVFHHHTGDFAVAHNGNIVNSSLLRKYLEKQGSLFHSTSDSEIIAHLIKKETNSEARIDAIMDALNMIEGGFAFVILTRNRLYACRDKYGLRPLSIARLGDGYVVSSETCAFDIIGAEYIRDVEPGEIICIDDKGIRSNHFSTFKRHKMCAMEYIYFARPDSTIEGCNVHAFRKESGRILYAEAPAEADIVVGVPDSSLSAAIGYSEASGIPYEMGLIKNRYIGRTFIQPSQELRENGVRLKLSSLKDIVKGKRVVLIDDSIVRGTTSKRIVRLLKDSGAAAVHVRIASPVYAYPCFYGVDTSTRRELIGASHTVEEIREIIGADSLAYLSTKGLLEAGRRSDLCMACFDGLYPTELYDNAVELEI